MKLTKEQCEEIFAQLDLTTQQYVVAITSELEAAKEKFPGWPTDRGPDFDTPIQVIREKLCHDFIEAAAIVAEESGELIRAALQFHNEDGQYYAMHKEAIQTGAMALRFLVEAPELQLP